MPDYQFWRGRKQKWTKFFTVVLLLFWKTALHLHSQKTEMKDHVTIYFRKRGFFQPVKSEFGVFL